MKKSNLGYNFKIFFMIYKLALKDLVTAATASIFMFIIIIFESLFGSFIQTAYFRDNVLRLYYTLYYVFLGLTAATYVIVSTYNLLRNHKALGIINLEIDAGISSAKSFWFRFLIINLNIIFLITIAYLISWFGAIPNKLSFDVYFWFIQTPILSLYVISFVFSGIAILYYAIFTNPLGLLTILFANMIVVFSPLVSSQVLQRASPKYSALNPMITQVYSAETLGIYLGTMANKTLPSEDNFIQHVNSNYNENINDSQTDLTYNDLFSWGNTAFSDLVHYGIYFPNTKLDFLKNTQLGIVMNKMLQSTLKLDAASPNIKSGLVSNDYFGYDNHHSDNGGSALDYINRSKLNINGFIKKINISNEKNNKNIFKFVKNIYNNFRFTNSENVIYNASSVLIKGDGHTYFEIKDLNQHFGSSYVNEEVEKDFSAYIRHPELMVINNILLNAIRYKNYQPLDADGFQPSSYANTISRAIAYNYGNVFSYISSLEAEPFTFHIGNEVLNRGSLFSLPIINYYDNNDINKIADNVQKGLGPFNGVSPKLKRVNSVYFVCFFFYLLFAGLSCCGYLGFRRQIVR